MSHHHRHKDKKKSKYKESKHPKPKNVGRFLTAVTRKRSSMDKVLNKYLKRYHIVGTSTEEYWRLKGAMILLGKEVAYGTAHSRSSS